MGWLVSTGGFKTAKWTYFGALVVTAAVSWLLRDYGHYVAGHIGPLSLCKTSEGTSAASCIGKSAVLRIGWANCMFFGVHFLLLIGVHTRDDPRRHIHTFCLPLQLLIWGAVLAVSFILPNHAIFIWGQVLLFCFVKYWLSIRVTSL
jgi:Serine incorporator (Serinc)